MDRIAAAVDGIERHIEDIEEALTVIDDPEDWRTALGLIHDGSSQLWKLKTRMLDEAMRRVRDRRPTI